MMQRPPTNPEVAEMPDPPEDPQPPDIGEAIREPRSGGRPAPEPAEPALGEEPFTDTAVRRDELPDTDFSAPLRP
jgi:hypothetical protein